MYMPNSHVDELAKIRGQIAELRARETTLEARFIKQRSSGPFTGFSGYVVVDQTAHEVFDIAKLPDAMLNDTRFYSLRHVTTVRIEPHETVNTRSLTAPRMSTTSLQSINQQ